jgi:DNA-directed RNA polymerase beta subunit
LAMKLVGNLIIDAFQRNYTPGKIRRIINEEPTQEFYNANFGKYDSVVKDAVLTSTQRQLAFAQLSTLVEMGFEIPVDYLMENLSIQNKTELVDAMKQAKEQKAQAEQQAAQAQQQLQAAQAKQLDALSTERYTRAEANQGMDYERREQALKAREEATLAKIRSLSELEDMDISKIRQLIEMAKLLETPAVIPATGKPTPSKPKKSVIKQVKNG